ncbi:hypothetical protein BH23ACT9_BH23ACT9_05910 [soil metagenome]
MFIHEQGDFHDAVGFTGTAVQAGDQQPVQLATLGDGQPAGLSDDAAELGPRQPAVIKGGLDLRHGPQDLYGTVEEADIGPGRCGEQSDLAAHGQAVAGAGVGQQPQDRSHRPVHRAESVHDPIDRVAPIGRQRILRRDQQPGGISSPTGQPTSSGRKGSASKSSMTSLNCIPAD